MTPIVMDAEDRRERAGAEASQWWVLLQDSNLRREQTEQYVDWLRESPLHVAAMMRVAKVHSYLRQFEHWEQINSSGSLDDEAVVGFPSPSSPSPASKRGRRRSVLRAWAMAASVLLVALAAILLYAGHIGHTVQTERGERRELTLADGSLVQVDPESRLHLKLDEHARHIVLEQGRAWFKVAPDPQRPFEVEANGTIIRALGTAFAVEQQKAGVRVTVSEGKVAVSAPATLPLQIVTAPVLSTNEQIMVKKSGSADPVRKVDASKELAWTKGRLVFESRPVAEVLEEFNRYNPMQLRVVDDALARLPVTAVFDASDPESFVAFLESVTEVAVNRENSNTIVLAAAR